MQDYYSSAADLKLQLSEAQQTELRAARGLLRRLPALITGVSTHVDIGQAKKKAQANAPRFTHNQLGQAKAWLKAHRIEAPDLPCWEDAWEQEATDLSKKERQQLLLQQAQSVLEALHRMQAHLRQRLEAAKEGVHRLTWLGAPGLHGGSVQPAAAHEVSVDGFAPVCSVA